MIRYICYYICQRSKDTEPEITSKADDYDIMVRQLQFDVKGTVRSFLMIEILRLSLGYVRSFQPTDRLKTEEEVAKEEQEKLEKLEVSRFTRQTVFLTLGLARRLDSGGRLADIGPVSCAGCAKLVTSHFSANQRGAFKLYLG